MEKQIRLWEHQGLVGIDFNITSDRVADRIIIVNINEEHYDFFVKNDIYEFQEEVKKILDKKYKD